MHSVTVTREYDAPPEAVREAVDETELFMLASGFDDVDVDGRTLTVVKRFALIELKLVLEVVDDTDAHFAYDQREGIFEEMRTTYAVDAAEEGSRLTATTEFSLDVALVGELLDATVIKRQRRSELVDQLDYVESAVSE